MMKHKSVEVWTACELHNSPDSDGKFALYIPKIKSS